MASIGKKILSAFIDIEDEKQTENVVSNPTLQVTKSDNQIGNKNPVGSYHGEANEKFRNYFEQLFKESNLQGPDYFEFLKMVEAMSSIPDEKIRYVSAFAGLSVQGLDKSKLVHSAQEYINILDADSVHFNATINTTLTENVERKKIELAAQSHRIQALTKEITQLNESILTLGTEIKENEEKIQNNVGGYATELERFKAKIAADIQKINSLI